MPIFKALWDMCKLIVEVVYLYIQVLTFSPHTHLKDTADAFIHYKKAK